MGDKPAAVTKGRVFFAHVTCSLWNFRLKNRRLFSELHVPLCKRHHLLFSTTETSQITNCAEPTSGKEKGWSVKTAHVHWWPVRFLITRYILCVSKSNSDHSSWLVTVRNHSAMCIGVFTKFHFSYRIDMARWCCYLRYGREIERLWSLMMTIMNESATSTYTQ